MSKSITADEVVVLYRQIARVYSRFAQPSSIEAAQTIASVYKGYSLKELSDAFMSYARQEKDPPTPATLLKYAQDARYNYNMSHALDTSGFRYDSNGNRLYNCPYCQDTGYMWVKVPEEQLEFLTPCVHNRESALLKVKRGGSFGMTVKKWNFRERLKWVPDGGYFAPVGSIPNGGHTDNLDDFEQGFQQWIGDTSYFNDDGELPF